MYILEQFNGFTNETLDFLRSIGVHNNRQWFEEHKNDFIQYVSLPMKQLSSQVYNILAERFPDMRMGTHLPRIYKDFRRVRDGRYYHDEYWFLITDQNYKENRLCFFFKITGYEYHYGTCLFMPSPAVMAAYRIGIENNRKAFERMVRDFQKQDIFQLEGSDYKIQKGDLSPLLNTWYNKRDISLIHTSTYDDGVIFQPDLVQILTEGFTWLIPFYKLILKG